MFISIIFLLATACWILCGWQFVYAYGMDWSYYFIVTALLCGFCWLCYLREELNSHLENYYIQIDSTLRNFEKYDKLLNKMSKKVEKLDEENDTILRWVNVIRDQRDHIKKYIGENLITESNLIPLWVRLLRENERRYDKLMMPLANFKFFHQDRAGFRIWKVLRDHEILSMYHLCMLSEEYVKGLKGIGPKGMKTLNTFMGIQGLCFSFDAPTVVRVHDIAEKLNLTKS